MKKIVLLALAGLAATTPALADNTTKSKLFESRADQYFKRMDTNQDGMVSRAENDAFVNQMFSEADTDKNNEINKEEFQAQKKREKGRYFSSLIVPPGGEMNPGADSTTGSKKDTPYKPQQE